MHVTLLHRWTCKINWQKLFYEQKDRCSSWPAGILDRFRIDNHHIIRCICVFKGEHVSVSSPPDLIRPFKSNLFICWKQKGISSIKTLPLDINLIIKSKYYREKKKWSLHLHLSGFSRPSGSDICRSASIGVRGGGAGGSMTWLKRLRLSAAPCRDVTSHRCCSSCCREQEESRAA